jgi:S-adenosylmethionine synthetase
MSTEAAAGKNLVSHVGKIYTFLTHFMADEIYKSVPGIREVYVWLCNQIGQPIEEPLIASAQLILKDNVSLASIQRDVEAVIAQELADIYEFTDRLTKGEFSVW